MRMIDADELLEILTDAKIEILNENIPYGKKVFKIYGLNYAIMALEAMKNGSSTN